MDSVSARRESTATDLAPHPHERWNPCGDTGKLPIGALTSTWYSTYYRGDTHKAYEGSYRVSSIVTFDWDGTTISNFKASGSYGTSHREVVYHLPSGDKQCTDESATATTETYGSASGSTFKLGYSSKNPLVSPEDLTPAIDSDVTGSVAADGTLSWTIKTTSFPVTASRSCGTVSPR